MVQTVYCRCPDLPGNLIAGCRLLRADRRPGAKLTRHNVRAAIFQLGAGPSAVIKEKIVPDLDQAGRAKDSITVVTKNPINPSPLRSWWKLVSSDSSAVLVPDTVPIFRGVVAVAVGAPDRILIGAGQLPGNLIAACRLLCADRRPAAKLTHHNVRAAILQRGARDPPTGIKEKIVSHLGQGWSSQKIRSPSPQEGEEGAASNREKFR